MLVYRNTTQINCIGMTLADTTASITPTLPGTLLAWFGVDDNTSTVVTPPAGMTQRHYSGNSDISSATYELSPQPAAATGTKTIVWSSSGQPVSLLFQLTNESVVGPDFVALASQANSVASASLVINKPSGTADGDLMIAVMCGDASVGSWSGDTGWTEVSDQTLGGAQRIAYKLAASEGSSYTFTRSLSTHILAGSILTYRYAAYDSMSGVDNTSPINSSPLSCSSSQSTVLFISSTSAANNTLTCDLFPTARVLNNDATAPSYVIKESTNHPIGPIGEPYFAISTASAVLSIKPTRTPT
jgi:hypothetical protein